jgi:uncharacterized protein (TIGR00369 family)
LSSIDIKTRTGPETVAWLRGVFREIPVLVMIGADPISYDTDSGELVVEYFAKDEFLNLIGTVQGGMLTSMLDNVMSFAVLSALEPGHAAPALEIKTNYVAPGPTGKIIGRGNVVRRGRSIAFMEGKLYSPDETLLATATGTAQIRQMKR